MIDWTFIISTAVSFMAASITKVGEGFAIKAGEALFEVVGKKFKKDKEGQEILTNFKDKPTRYQSALIDILNEKAQSDKSFGEEIRNIVEKNSTKVSGISQTAQGSYIAQSAGNGSIASVNSSSSDDDSGGFLGLFKKKKK